MLANERFSSADVRVTLAPASEGNAPAGRPANEEDAAPESFGSNCRGDIILPNGNF